MRWRVKEKEEALFCFVWQIFQRPPREIDFHDVVYIPEGNPFKIWYSESQQEGGEYLTGLAGSLPH